MDELIAVVGSCNVDHVWVGERIPGPGETLLADGYEVHPGGKGANQATAAAKMGARVQMAALEKMQAGLCLKASFKRPGSGSATFKNLMVSPLALRGSL